MRIGIAALFALSGFSALIYQVAWQRKLYTIFGVTSEASAVIVACFMLGTGCGALAGGALSRSDRVSLLRSFAWIEFSIGVCALISLPALAAIDALYLKWNHRAAAFGLIGVFLLIPTLFMGASLPVLVQFLRSTNRLAESVQLLYAANSFGAGAACLITVLVLFELFGLSGSIQTAAAINLFVGMVIWTLDRRHAAISHS